jgi:hypothetical protein
LIDSEESVSGTVFVAFVVVIVLLGGVVELRLQFFLVSFVTVGVVICRDDSRISWNHLTIFDDDLERKRVN